MYLERDLKAETFKSMLIFAFGYSFWFEHPYINSREQFILTMQ